MISPLVQGFLTAAERDVAAAERLLPDLPDLAVFHAQQAVEKLARAVCLHEGLPDLRTHDIARIAERLPKEHLFQESILELSGLTSAATAWRYPGAEGEFPTPPKLHDVQATLVRVKTLQTEIHDWLSAP